MTTKKSMTKMRGAKITTTYSAVDPGCHYEPSDEAVKEQETHDVDGPVVSSIQTKTVLKKEAGDDKEYNGKAKEDGKPIQKTKPRRLRFVSLSVTDQ